jgi:hypothetical protein
MNITKNQLYELYIVQKLTRIQVAEKLGVGATTVLYYMKKFDIPRRTVSESLIGKPKTPEHRRKLSESTSGAKNHNFGKKSKLAGANHPHFGGKSKSHGKRCWYTLPDGKVVSMRSQWEVWYAEYLRAKGIEFLYEPHTFTLQDGSAYTPDFFLVNENKYIEVKGWLTDKHKCKIETFNKEHPDKTLILADKQYLQALGIDLRKKWISTKPLFPCELCHKEYHRSYPQQRFCSVNCRNKAVATGLNVADPKVAKRIYKGSQKGQKNNGRKLTEQQVTTIRQMRSQGRKYKEIADKTGASIGNIGNIVNGRSW